MIRNSISSLFVAGLIASLGCAGSGGPDPYECRIKVVEAVQFNDRPGEYDVTYLVQGTAGSPAVVSLAAKTAEGRFIAGLGVDVGPGPFRAEVAQKLTGRPAELIALLEVGGVGGERCRDDAEVP